MPADPGARTFDPEAKSPDRIAGMFDAIAPRYDLLNRLLSAGIDRRWRSAAIRALHLTGRETLIDVCTGTADVALGRFSTMRRGASVGSWMLDASSGAVPRSVTAVAVPRWVTRTSRMIGENVVTSSAGPLAEAVLSMRSASTRMTLRELRMRGRIG